MPMSRRVLTTPGTIYGRPAVGPTDHTFQLACNLTLLSAAEIDEDGYLKPGVIWGKDGTPIGVAPEYAFGYVPEPIKVANGNAGGDISGAGTQQIGVVIIGAVNRKIIEDNLGRVLTADEIASFERAGSKLHLLF